MRCISLPTFPPTNQPTHTSLPSLCVTSSGGRNTNVSSASSRMRISGSGGDGGFGVFGGKGKELSGDVVEIWDVRRGWIVKWAVGRSAVEGGVAGAASPSHSHIVGIARLNQLGLFYYRHSICLFAYNLGTALLRDLLPASHPDQLT